MTWGVVSVRHPYLEQGGEQLARGVVSVIILVTRRRVLGPTRCICTCRAPTAARASTAEQLTGSGDTAAYTRTRRQPAAARAYTAEQLIGGGVVSFARRRVPTHRHVGSSAWSTRVRRAPAAARAYAATPLLPRSSLHVNPRVLRRVDCARCGLTRSLPRCSRKRVKTPG